MNKDKKEEIVKDEKKEEKCECGCNCDDSCTCGCKEGKKCCCQDNTCSCGCGCKCKCKCMKLLVLLVVFFAGIGVGVTGKCLFPCMKGPMPVPPHHAMPTPTQAPIPMPQFDDSKGNTFIIINTNGKDGMPDFANPDCPCKKKMAHEPRHEDRNNHSHFTSAEQDAIAK